MATLRMAENVTEKYSFLVHSKVMYTTGTKLMIYFIDN